jgi:CPA1 family monovalent cation:H+ antiporter
MFGHGGNVGSLFLILLGLAVAFALLARRVHIAYPVVLVLGGLGLSVIPGTPQIRLEPNLIFWGILPPVLFAAAWATPWRDFSHHFVSIVSLAFGLVLFTIIGVAVTAHWLLPPFDWRVGAILGAIVAPTDAIAATAIASQLEMPRRLVDVLEGESLINDATALVAVEFAVALVVSQVAPNVEVGLVRLVYVAGVGAVIGAAIAVAVDWLERRIEDAPIEMAISLMVPYSVYLAADGLRASGVVAVVTCGLMLSRRSAEFYSPAVRLQVSAVWEAVVFILNGVVFVLIGLQLRAIVARLATIPMSQLLTVGALFSVLLAVLRLAWVGPGAHLSYFVRHHFLHQTDLRPGWRELVVVGWSGIRGVISLAAAFALPELLSDGRPFPQRDLIVFLTFSVVVFTIVVQTLTLAPLIRLLGIEGGVGIGCEERDARRIALRAALDRLEEQRLHDSSDYAALYDDIAEHYRDRLLAIDTAEQDPRTLHHQRYLSLMRELIDVQRRTLLDLRTTGRINDEVLRHVERELDLESVRLRSGNA